MMGAVLALGSALCYGVADFAGGLLSRRAHYAAVALIGQAGGLVVAALAATMGMNPAADGLPGFAWGALSGLGTGAGMLFLYRGMSRGAVSVVVSVSAVSGVALPVLAAVAFLGERPSPVSVSGIAVAVPALFLVSRTRVSRTGASRTGDGSGVAAPAAVDGLLAGTGIAVQYFALAQAPSQAGLWPVAAGRIAACLAIAPLVVSARVPLRLPPHLALAAAANGALAAAALTLYMLATREQLLAVAVVLSSLYPAIPVLLGLTVLRERLTRSQLAGMIAATAAVALLTAG